MRARRFAPLFWTQALGALNDNMFKNALVVLALFRLAHLGPVVVALSGGVFLAPYAVFSATAGQIADAHEKSGVIRLVKFWELGLMALASLGFLSGSFSVLLAVLFGLGVQAAWKNWPEPRADEQSHTYPCRRRAGGDEVGAGADTAARPGGGADPP